MKKNIVKVSALLLTIGIGFLACKKDEPATTTTTVKGCTDPKALNYNPNATESDECIYDNADNAEIALITNEAINEIMFVNKISDEQYDISTNQKKAKNPCIDIQKNIPNKTITIIFGGNTTVPAPSDYCRCSDGKGRSGKITINFSKIYDKDGTTKAVLSNYHTAIYDTNKVTKEEFIKYEYKTEATLDVTNDAALKDKKRTLQLSGPGTKLANSATITYLSSVKKGTKMYLTGTYVITSKDQIVPTPFDRSDDELYINIKNAQALVEGGTIPANLASFGFQTKTNGDILMRGNCPYPVKGILQLAINQPGFDANLNDPNTVTELDFDPPSGGPCGNIPGAESAPCDTLAQMTPPPNSTNFNCQNLGQNPSLTAILCCKICPKVNGSFDICTFNPSDPQYGLTPGQIAALNRYKELKCVGQNPSYIIECEQMCGPSCFKF